MDRRVEVLIKAACEDLEPLVKRIREQGWPVEVIVDCKPDLSKYTVEVKVTIIPVSVPDRIPDVPLHDVRR